MQSPVVTVVIPTRDRAQLLPQAIGSVLQQTLTAWELIIVDDGSTDHTADVVAAFAVDPRVCYVRQDPRGVSAARNHGASRARAPFLAFLDSDDRFLPGALAALLEAFGANTSTAMTIGGYERIDEQGRVLGQRRQWEESGLSLESWLFNCLAINGAVLLRRDWFERVGGFDLDCPPVEDWDLFLRLAAAAAPMAFVRRSVVQYRQHAGNSVKDLARQHEGSLRVLRKFFDGQPAPTAGIASLRSRAFGWMYAVSARRAFLAGDSTMRAVFGRPSPAIRRCHQWPFGGVAFPDHAARAGGAPAPVRDRRRGPALLQSRLTPSPAARGTGCILTLRARHVSAAVASFAAPCASTTCRDRRVLLRLRRVCDRAAPANLSASRDEPTRRQRARTRVRSGALPPRRTGRRPFAEPQRPRDRRGG
jgi:GT2 family glycosyltransferase